MQYSFGAYIFDPAQYELRHMGQSVALRPQACELLAYLLQHRDRVVPKEELLRRQAGVTGRGPRLGSPFVGRERELMLLHDHLAAAMRGQGQVIGLVGEPGIGKTRLLTEFCHHVSWNQMTVYEGRCLSYGQAAPYLLMRDLVRQMCALVEGDMSATHTAAVQHRLHACGITTESDVALLLQLLDLLVHPACLAPYSPETQRARTFALLRHLILHMAQQQPLVLMVENLHWIDPTSDAWLGSLIERLAEAPVLLLATYRRGYQPTWSARSAMTQIALTPLHTQDSRTVVRSVLGSGALPEAWLRTVVARAEGNPFFLEELAWHAAERDELDRAGVVPETVQAVLAARMDRCRRRRNAFSRRRQSWAPRCPCHCCWPLQTCPKRRCTEVWRTCKRPSSFMKGDSFPIMYTPSNTPSPTRWPTTVSCRSGGAPCMSGLSRPSKGSPGAGWPSRWNGWPTMLCGESCGTRHFSTVVGLAIRQRRIRPIAKP